MTVPPHRKPCDPCSGSGLVARPPRRLPNGELDPFDTVQWPSVICETCQGAGSVPFSPRPEEALGVTSYEAAIYC